MEPAQFDAAVARLSGGTPNPSATENVAIEMKFERDGRTVFVGRQDPKQPDQWMYRIAVLLSRIDEHSDVIGKPSRLARRTGFLAALQSLGLGRRLSTGDRKFDETVFFQGDETKARVASWLESQEIRDKARLLVESGASVLVGRAGVRALWSKQNAPELPAERLEELMDAVSSLERALPPAKQWLSADGLGGSGSLGWIPTVVAALVVGVGSVLASFSDYFTLFEHGSHATQIKWGIGIGLVLCVWLITRRRSGGGVPLLAAVVAAPFIGNFAVLGPLGMLNHALGEEAQTIHTKLVGVSRKRTTGPTFHDIELEPWGDLEEAVVLPSGETDYARFYQLAPGTPMSLSGAVGAFGIHWVDLDSIERTKPTP